MRRLYEMASNSRYSITRTALSIVAPPLFALGALGAPVRHPCATGEHRQCGPVASHVAMTPELESASGSIGTVQQQLDFAKARCKYVSLNVFCPCAQSSHGSRVEVLTCADTAGSSCRCRSRSQSTLGGYAAQLLGRASQGTVWHIDLSTGMCASPAGLFPPLGATPPGRPDSRPDRFNRTGDLCECQCCLAGFWQ